MVSLFLFRIVQLDSHLQTRFVLLALDVSLSLYIYIHTHTDIEIYKHMYVFTNHMHMYMCACLYMDIQRGSTHVWDHIG